MSAAFTPGPWQFVPWHIAESASEVRAPDGWLVCATSSDANARLIAAAPAMFEALSIIFNHWEGYVDPDGDMPGWPDDSCGVVNDAFKDDFYAKAKAALKQARGQ